MRPIPFPLAGASGEALPLRPPDAALPDVDTHGLVRDLRATVASAFDAQLERVETSFGAVLEGMEAKLAQAELELAAVRAEHERVKKETERKAEALRELKKALENI